MQSVVEWPDGHVVRTLDRECNERASRWGYVKEYKKWFDAGSSGARKAFRLTGRDPLRGIEPFQFKLAYDFHPARFVRQVLGMFLAVQDSEHLFVTHPALPGIIGPDTSSDEERRRDGLDISPLHLYLSAYNEIGRAHV